MFLSGDRATYHSEGKKLPGWGDESAESSTCDNAVGGDSFWTRSECTSISGWHFERRYSIITGFEVAKYANQNSVAQLPLHRVCRHTDTTSHTSHPYTPTARCQPRSMRLRVLTTLIITDYIASLISSSLLKNVNGTPKRFAKHLHRLTHAPLQDTKAVFQWTEIIRTRIHEAIDEDRGACFICTESGRTATRRGLPLTHINEELNTELQADFASQSKDVAKRTLLVISDTSTSFGEASNTTKKDTVTICTPQENDRYHTTPPGRSVASTATKVMELWFQKNARATLKARSPGSHRQKQPCWCVQSIER